MLLKFFEVQVNRTFVNRLTGWKTRTHVCCYSWEKALLKLKFWKSTSETFHFCRVKHLYMTDWIAIYAWPQIKHCCEYIDWIFTFTQTVVTNYKWCDYSDNFFPFTLTDDGVYANTEPMKIIVPLDVKEIFTWALEKKLCTYFVYPNYVINKAV